MSLPREIKVTWACVCGHVVAHSVRFDTSTRPYSTTHQCRSCGRVLEVHRPKVLDLGQTAMGGGRS